MIDKKDKRDATGKFGKWDVKGSKERETKYLLVTFLKPMT